MADLELLHLLLGSLCESSGEKSEDIDGEPLGAEDIGGELEPPDIPPAPKRHRHPPDILPAPKRHRLHKKQDITRAPASRSSHVAARMFALPPKAYRMLRRMVLPLMFWQILFFVCTSMVNETHWETVEVNDFYSGRALMTDQGLMQGYRVNSYECLNEPKLENACGPEGVLTMLVYVRCYRKGSLNHWGTVCSSWLWIARGTTGRSGWNPEGSRRSNSTKLGNTMVTRMTLMLYLLIGKRCIWILEQPASSLMSYFPTMVRLRNQAGCSWGEVQTWIAEFGGDDIKPTTLIGNAKWLHCLTRTLSKESRKRIAVSDMVIRYEGVDGKTKVVGNKDVMKQSQEYPLGYAQEVIKNLIENDVHEPDSDSSESDEDGGYEAGFDDDSVWKDAHLDKVLKLCAIHPSSVPSPLQQSFQPS